MAELSRVIVALPNPVEMHAVAKWLAADGFRPIVRMSEQTLLDEVRARPFLLVVADAVFAARCGLLNAVRAVSSPSSVILVGDAGTHPGTAMTGQAMYMTRPIDPATLACFVSMGLLDTRPTRRSVRKPVIRFEATVNGVPSHILDVSAEGLRLEVRRDHRAAVLPPLFVVRVPLVGVAVTVQRMWARPSSQRPPTTWYGGALYQNRASAELAWRSFVDTVPITGDAGFQLGR